jgi:hypothetical protein
MIRTLIVDHHPALRAGVKVVLEAEGDMAVVGDTGAKRSFCRCYGAPGQTSCCSTATHRRSPACAHVGLSSA